jgi:hypothetical protein
MSDRPPFDTIKWSFFLVAFVIATHCIIVMAGVAFCWVHTEEALTSRCSDLRGQLIEMLAAALAAALAFAGGYRGGPPPSPPPPRG